MTWLAVHPSSTETVAVPRDVEGAPRFVIGFWPPRIAERINAEMARLRKHDDDDADASISAKQFQAIAESRYDLTRSMIVYGVRSWEGMGPELAPKLEQETIDGISYDRLSEASLSILHVNKLALDLAIACLRYNSLSEEEKKTSTSRSSSAGSRSDTSVASATPNGKARPVGASSASTDGSSKSAHTG